MFWSHVQYLRRKTGQARRRPQLLELAAPAVVACGDSTPMTALASRLQELLLSKMLKQHEAHALASRLQELLLS